MAGAEEPGACLEPRFVEGSAGKLFWTFFSPSRKAESHTACIIFPPFAEEMNKSRRMLAMQGRRQAKAGVITLLPDLYGTGDSEGDLSEATVAGWIDDVGLMYQHLVDQGIRRVSFLGVRMGSLLCGPAVERLPANLRAGPIVFWQPFTSGQVLIREFRRLKVAADMARGDSASGVSSEGFAEIAGYLLGDQLARELSALDLLENKLPDNAVMGWIEMSLSQSPTIRGRSRRVVSELQARGHKVSEMALRCPPFWSATEIVESEDVLAATTSFFLAHLAQDYV